MREVIAILVALAIGVYYFMAGTSKGRRFEAARNSVARRPLLNLVIILPALAILYAMTFGYFHLAAYLHDTDAPTRDQLDQVRAILAAAIVAPFLALTIWLKWHERRAIRDGVRRARHAPGYADPSRERRLPADE